MWNSSQYQNTDYYSTTSRVIIYVTWHNIYIYTGIANYRLQSEHLVVEVGSIFFASWCNPLDRDVNWSFVRYIQLRNFTSFAPKVSCLMKASLLHVCKKATLIRGLRDRDRMVVRFTTTYPISAYHHWCCEFETQFVRGVQHYVIKFVSNLRQRGGFRRVLRFPLQKKLTATI